MQRAKYAPEFKEEAVKQVVVKGHPVVDVAKRLGADQFGGGLPNPLAVETALLQQTSVRHRKTTIDMNAPFVLSARDAAVTHAVSGFCGAAYEALRQAENLVLTGGGSVWFASVLKEHTLTTPQLLLPDSPGLANVLGYWHYGHSKQQAQGNSH